MAAPATNFDAILPRLDLSSADDLLVSLVRELVTLRDDPEELARRSLEQPGERASGNPSALSTSITIDAAYSLRAEQGFHSLEYDRAGGAFRWTGPNRAFHFEVMADRTQPLAMRLRYFRIFENPQNEPVRCYVDGVEVEARTVSASSEFEVHATMPTRDSVGATNLTLVCPRVRSPSDIGASTDLRKLGLTFRWLKIDLPSNVKAESGAPKPSVAGKILRRALKLTQIKGSP